MENEITLSELVQLDDEGFCELSSMNNRTYIRVQFWIQNLNSILNLVQLTKDQRLNEKQ